MAVAGAAFAAPATTSASAVAPPGAFTNTRTSIHLGLAFDYSATDASAVASKVDYVFGGYFADWNFGFYPAVQHLDGYLPFDTDPYPQSMPGHDLAWWQANHPDWVVYQCDGTTPAYYGSGNTNVPLDFSNPAVRAWQVSQAATLLSQGAQGIAFDDFAFANFENRCGVYRNGVWTPLGYPGLWQDNATLNSDMMGWLQDVSGQLRQQFPGKTITLNYAPTVSGLANLEQIAPYIDMDFDEAGFTDYGGHNLSGSAWQQEVSSFEYLNSLGKAFDVNGTVKASDNSSVTHAQMNWVLANYLLVKGAHSYTYVYAGDNAGFTGSPSGYGTFYDRPEYHVPIGSPTSSRFQSQGVQRRMYSNGLALVNPSASQTYTVTLALPHYDMYGRRYTSVTLAPTTGIVLLDGATSTSAVARIANAQGGASRMMRRHKACVRGRARRRCRHHTRKRGHRGRAGARGHRRS